MRCSLLMSVFVLLLLVCITSIRSWQVLDLLGFDYVTDSYDAMHAKVPAIPSISSETSSAVSDRGEYANDPQAGHVTGYSRKLPFAR